MASKRRPSTASSLKLPKASLEKLGHMHFGGRQNKYRYLGHAQKTLETFFAINTSLLCDGHDGKCPGYPPALVQYYYSVLRHNATFCCS